MPSQRLMDTDVHNSIAHDNPKPTAKQMSTNGWIQNYIYHGILFYTGNTGILFSNKKERTAYTHSPNKDGSQECFAAWKRRHWLLIKHKFKSPSTDWVVIGKGVLIGSKQGSWLVFGVMEQFSNWIIAMMAQSDKFTKKYWVVHLQWLNRAMLPPMRG